MERSGNPDQSGIGKGQLATLVWQIIKFHSLRRRYHNKALKTSVTLAGASGPLSSSYKYAIRHTAFVYDHTTLNIPVLVRSPKLSNVGLC